jgi:hypothetical protein
MTLPELIQRNREQRAKDREKITYPDGHMIFELKENFNDRLDYLDALEDAILEVDKELMCDYYDHPVMVDGRPEVEERHNDIDGCTRCKILEKIQSKLLTEKGGEK